MIQELVIICGRLCSGKGYHSSRMSESVAEKIGVSKVVKEITGGTTRSELQDTADLDIQIADEIIKRLEQSDKWIGLIEGIRQKTIFEQVYNYFSPSMPVKVLWLEVPADVRKRRFEYKKSQTNRAYTETDTFEQADKKDIKLGLDELYNHLIIDFERFQTLDHYHRLETTDEGFEIFLKQKTLMQ